MHWRRCEPCGELCLQYIIAYLVECVFPQNIGLSWVVRIDKFTVLINKTFSQAMKNVNAMPDPK